MQRMQRMQRMQQIQKINTVKAFVGAPDDDTVTVTVTVTVMYDDEYFIKKQTRYVWSKD